MKDRHSIRSSSQDLATDGLYQWFTTPEHLIRFPETFSRRLGLDSTDMEISRFDLLFDEHSRKSLKQFRAATDPRGREVRITLREGHPAFLVRGHRLADGCLGGFFLETPPEKPISGDLQPDRDYHSPYMAMLDHLPVETWLMNPRGVVVVQNAASAARRGNQLNRNITEAFPSPVLDIWRGLSRQIAAGFSISEPFMVREQDRVSFFVLNFTPIVSAGKTAFILGSVVETSSESIKCERLISTGKLATLGGLISGVTHEINNPNNCIMLNAEFLIKAWRDIDVILLEKYGDGDSFTIGGFGFPMFREEMPEILSGILEGSLRINRFITELRQYGRETPGEGETLFDVNTSLQKAAQLLANTIRIRTERFSLDIEPDLPLVSGSAQKFEMVVLILVLNALKALRDKTNAVTLKSQHPPGSQFLIVSVEDEGCGIEEKQVCRVFDPFFTTHAHEGSPGLGLTTCRGLVSELKGSLTIESTPGRGTIVRIHLPFHKGSIA